MEGLLLSCQCLKVLPWPKKSVILDRMNPLNRPTPKQVHAVYQQGEEAMVAVIQQLEARVQTLEDPPPTHRPTSASQTEDMGITVATLVSRPPAMD